MQRAMQVFILTVMVLFFPVSIARSASIEVSGGLSGEQEIGTTVYYVFHFQNNGESEATVRIAPEETYLTFQYIPVTGSYYIVNKTDMVTAFFLDFKIDGSSTDWNTLVKEGFVLKSKKTLDLQLGFRIPESFRLIPSHLIYRFYGGDKLLMRLGFEYDGNLGVYDSYLIVRAPEPKFEVTISPKTDFKIDKTVKDEIILTANVSASIPAVYDAKYGWSCTGGLLNSTNARTVKWSAADLSEGSYIISCEVKVSYFYEKNVKTIVKSASANIEVISKSNVSIQFLPLGLGVIIAILLVGYKAYLAPSAKRGSSR
jgi:hypothetical protein